MNRRESKAIEHKCGSRDEEIGMTMAKEQKLITNCENEASWKI